MQSAGVMEGEVAAERHLRLDLPSNPLSYNTEAVTGCL